ncbi:MAG: CRTAC1 family protein, partial [Acidimicrobiia bacterium]|nr:CRTAC1 family protein [Acidimicrobiia bacterium]
TFEEVTASAGIDQIYDGEFQYFVGGGLAVFDCDADRKPELFVAGGTEPAALFHNRSIPGSSIRFSRLDRPNLELTGVTGAYPLDIDSDGVTDLAVLRVGENVLMRGLGECRFEHRDPWNVDGGDAWTVAFSATWEDEAALPTMAFGNYLRLKEGGARDECEDHFLFRPGESGYEAPTVLTPGFCTLSMLFSDWSRSGTADLRMANDRHYSRDGREQLWDMSGRPEPYTEEDGWQPLRIWGMGIASQDLDGDGVPEVYLTSQGDNKLQRLVGGPGNPEYVDVALEAGVNAHRPFVGETLRPSTAWHAEFDDVNNDGFVDLFVTKGNVEAQPDFAREDPNNLLLGQADGTFSEVAGAAGVIDLDRSRGGAVVDLDLDGALDIVVVERREPVRVWRNIEPGGGHWLALDVSQPGMNRDAVGGWIEVDMGHQILSREITVGGGHASGQLGWHHVGLGANERPRVRIVWPDGSRSGWEDLAANRFVIWDRTAGPIEWTPSG